MNGYVDRGARHFDFAPSVNLPHGQRLHSEPASVPEPSIDYVLGCDLGQTIDPTALCVIERAVEPTGEFHQPEGD